MESINWVIYNALGFIGWYIVFHRKRGKGSYFITFCVPYTEPERKYIVMLIELIINIKLYITKYSMNTVRILLNYVYPWFYLIYVYNVTQFLNILLLLKPTQPKRAHRENKLFASNKFRIAF